MKFTLASVAVVCVLQSLAIADPGLGGGAGGAAGLLGTLKELTDSTAKGSTALGVPTKPRLARREGDSYGHAYGTSPPPPPPPAYVTVYKTNVVTHVAPTTVYEKQYVPTTAWEFSTATVVSTCTTTVPTTMWSVSTCYKTKTATETTTCTTTATETTTCYRTVTDVKTLSVVQTVPTTETCTVTATQTLTCPTPKNYAYGHK